MSAAPPAAPTALRLAAAQLLAPGASGALAVRGMATLVGPARAVTPAHVVEGLREGDRVVLRNPLWASERPREATLAERSDAADLAVLRLDEPLDAFLAPLAGDAAPGAEWEGFLLVPGADDGVAVRGRVDGAVRVEARVLLQLSPDGGAVPMDGMSGAPIATGAGLAGIVWGAASRSSGPWFALPSGVLAAAAAGAKERVAVPGEIASAEQGTEAPRRGGALPGYASDAVGAANPDRLGIQDEVNALCAVLAARSTRPPLSLGLFGDWGTGKSFFMKKMEERIDRLALRARERGEAGKPSHFCPHVVQLWFNAWHYTDTNLWASLVTEIFEGLAEALDEEPGPTRESRERLVQRMKSRRDELAQAERDRASAEARMRESEEKLGLLKREAVGLPQALESIASDEGVRRYVLGDPRVKERMEAAARMAGFREARWAATELQEELIRLRGLGGTLRATWLWIAEARGRGWRVPLLVGIVLLLAAFPALVALAADRLAGRELSMALLAALPPVAAAVEWLRRGVRRGGRIVGVLEDARRQAEGIIVSVRERQREREEALHAYQQQLRSELRAAEREIGAVTEELQSLEGQLRDLRADQQLYRFIRERNASTDYSQHRGIIGRAQKDFERLSDLLTSAHDTTDGSELPRVDRIILYIDDLDRCPEEQVVQVLQAVHLLLAFPLFVAVVGVDSRWLLHALQGHSSVFGARGDPGMDLSPGEAVLWASTPQNYLEKIFQIPFALRPMDARGFGSLIDSLVPLDGVEASPAVPPARGARPGAAPGGPPREDGRPQPDAAARLRVVDGAAIPAAAGGEEGEEAEEIDMLPEALVLKPWELEVMKRLHPMIASPRAAKRLVNLYRLILASIPPAELDAFRDPATGDFRVVLLLLALLTGYPDEAGELLLDLRRSPTGERWWDFAERLRPRASASPDATGTMGHVRATEAARWSLLLQALDQLRPLIPEEESCARFARWARGVARYSFQSGRTIAALRGANP